MLVKVAVSKSSSLILVVVLSSLTFVVWRFLSIRLWVVVVRQSLVALSVRPSLGSSLLVVAAWHVLLVTFAW